MTDVNIDELQKKINQLPHSIRSHYQHIFEIYKKSPKTLWYVEKQVNEALARTKEEIKEQVKETVEEGIKEAIAGLESTVKKVRDYVEDINWVLSHNSLYKAYRPDADNEVEEQILDMVDEEYNEFLEEREEELGVDLDHDHELGEPDEHVRRVYGGSDEKEGFRSQTLEDLEMVVSTAKSMTVEDVRKSIYTIVALFTNQNEIKKSEKLVRKGYIDSEYRAKITKLMQERLDALINKQLVPLLYLYHAIGVPTFDLLDVKKSKRITKGLYDATLEALEVIEKAGSKSEKVIVAYITVNNIEYDDLVAALNERFMNYRIDGAGNEYTIVIYDDIALKEAVNRLNDISGDSEIMLIIEDIKIEYV